MQNKSRRLTEVVPEDFNQDDVDTSKNAITADVEDEDENLRPMSQEEIDAEMKRMTTVDPKELNDIFAKYSQAINGILVAARKQATDDSEIVELEQIKRIMNMAPNDLKFIRSKNKLWAVRKRIVNKDTKYFLEKDYSKTIKKDQNQEWLESIVEFVRDRFATMTDKEKEFYWSKAAALLNCVLRFKKLLGDYDE